MKNLKVGDKVIYIGKHGNLFTEGREYEVLMTVDKCELEGNRYREEPTVGITDDGFYDIKKCFENARSVLPHFITESFFNEYFKIKSQYSCKKCGREWEVDE